MQVIVPIVEGHSEVESVPVLLHRMLQQRGMHQVTVHRPIRIPKSKLVKQSELERAVQLATMVQDCNAIVVLIDADVDCPKELGPQLLSWAGNVGSSIPTKVVLAKVEFESWFVGSIESLRDKRGVTTDATAPDDPEAIRDAKGWLTANMMRGRRYLGTVDQPALAEQFDLELARVRCPSFDKFVRDIESVIPNLTTSIGDEEHQQ